MEQVNCDFCGGDAFEEVARQTDRLHGTTQEYFTIVRCRNCGLNFVNPRPDVAEIGKYYSSGYSFHAGQSGLKRAILTILTRLANSPLHALLNLVPLLGARLVPYIKPDIADPVRKYFKGGRILDIGCGSGDSAHFWGAAGALQAYRQLAEAHGLEVADGARGILEANGIKAYRQLSDVPPELAFDIIRMNWSLEHVHSPTAYFEFLACHLSANGKAIIAVPNFGGMIYQVDRECVELPIHLYHFRRQDMQNYADRHGLEILEYRTFSYPQMYAYSAGIFPGVGKYFPEKMGLSEAYHMQRALDRFDAAGLGNDMIVVLQKKHPSGS